MDLTWLVPLLALMTIGTVLILALIGKERTERRLHRDEPASSLARDGDDHAQKDV